MAATGSHTVFGRPPCSSLMLFAKPAHETGSAVLCADSQLTLAFAACCVCIVPTRSAGVAFNGAIHTVKVLDNRPLTGESGELPRVISSLPFDDAGDTSIFKDDYGCAATVSPTKHTAHGTSMIAVRTPF